MMDNLLSYWRQMKPREKRWVLTVSVFVLAVLVWWLALAPALNILRLAPEQHRNLDAHIQTMQSMSAEARALQNQPKLGLEEAQKALQSSVTQRFSSNPGSPNSAQLSIAGERATLTLKNANPQELALWLTQARVNARALPSEVRLTRSANTNTNTNTNTGTGTGTNSIGWDGSLVLNLPRK